MRCYLHGDVTEHDPALVYCAACDAFVPVSHFYEPDAHSWSRYSDYYRFEVMRKNFKRGPGMAFDGTRYTRPQKARNILA